MFKRLEALCNMRYINVYYYYYYYYYLVTVGDHLISFRKIHNKSTRSLDTMTLLQTGHAWQNGKSPLVSPHVHAKLFRLSSPISSNSRKHLDCVANLNRATSGVHSP